MHREVELRHCGVGGYSAAAAQGRERQSGPVRYREAPAALGPLLPGGNRDPAAFGIAVAAGLEAAGVSCVSHPTKRGSLRADSPGLSQRLQLRQCRWMLGMQVGGGATTSQGLVPAADCRSCGASLAATNSPALLATALGTPCVGVFPPLLPQHREI